VVQSRPPYSSEEDGVANDRLRDALLRQGLTPAELAEELHVDAKTVERWTADIRARRAGATSDSDTKPVNGSSKHPDLAGVTT